VWFVLVNGIPVPTAVSKSPPPSGQTIVDGLKLPRREKDKDDLSAWSFLSVLEDRIPG
jgi:hypothetical protein